MRLLWKAVALVFALLALASAALPVLPVVPFLLLAVTAADKGWPRAVERLARNPRLGPLVVGWRERGALPRRAKWGAIFSLLVAVALACVAPIPAWLGAALAISLGAIALWIWLRPED